MAGSSPGRYPILAPGVVPLGGWVFPGALSHVNPRSCTRGFPDRRDIADCHGNSDCHSSLLLPPLLPLLPMPLLLPLSLLLLPQPLQLLLPAAAVAVLLSHCCSCLAVAPLQLPACTAALPLQLPAYL